MFDIETQRCLDVFMRTTIDLPDDLLRKAKAKAEAALSGLKLKELIARYVEQGLRQGGSQPAGESRTPRQRSPLPVIQKGATGQPIPALSKAELTRIEQEQDSSLPVEWLDDWVKMADAAMSRAAPGPTAREILDEDRNRLESRRE